MRQTSTPRWVKVFGMIFIGLALALVIVHLTGNSSFRHTPPVEQGTKQP